MKLDVIFRWFDLWVGVYFDKSKKTIYIFPIPMLGLRIKFGEKA